MDNSSVPDVMKLYSEINANIRFTDEISFKLLGLVPFVSGAGILGISLSNLVSSPYAALISFFAAIVTFALFMWEIKNIEICKWWISRLEKIEEICFELSEEEICRPKPKLIGLSARKSTAEKIIYTGAIGSWMIFGIMIMLNYLELF